MKKPKRLPTKKEHVEKQTTQRTRWNDSLKWENNYIEKKLKELDEHPERNKTSSGILEETLIFLFFAIFFGCIIYFMPTRP